MQYVSLTPVLLSQLESCIVTNESGKVLTSQLNWTGSLESLTGTSTNRPKKQPETPVKKKVQKVRHERSLARDPFKLKMKVKLEPVALREYEKKRRRSESKNRDRAPVEKRKKKKIVIPKRRKRRRSSSDEDEEYAPAPAYVRHATAAPSAPKKVQ